MLQVAGDLLSIRQKSNKSNFGRENMKRPSTALRFLTQKKLKYAILFNEDGKGT